MVTAMPWLKPLHPTILFPLMNDQRGACLFGWPRGDRSRRETRWSSGGTTRGTHHVHI